MKKIFLLLTPLFLVFIASNGQRVSYDTYWIQLKDKDGTLYNIESPESFLSEAAIERREKAAIEITEEDLPVSQVYLDSISDLGLEIIGTSKWFNSVVVRSTDSILLEKVTSLSFVEDFSTDYANFSAGKQESTEFDISNSNEEVEAYFYGVASRQINILGGNFLHNYGYEGQGITIAILDAGFFNADEINAFDHVRNENRLLGYKDFVNPGSDFFTHSTHGLAVFSTIAAYLPDTFVGTAPDASFMLLRSEDASSENKVEEVYWLMAAEYADSAGADIITSSLGYRDFPVSEKMNYAFEDLTGDRALVTRAAEKAFSKGMIVVASAGNEGNNALWERITPPADGPNVIAVGSVDTAYQVTSFSSRGNTADGRIKPDVMAVGFRTKIINSRGEPADGFGTSFAAPQVAGLIACLWQAAPDKTNKEIIAAVRRSSDQYSSPDSISGFGIPNFMHALYELRSNNVDEMKQEFIISPNPFITEFEVFSTDPDLQIDQLDIFSSDGKLIYSYEEGLKPGDRIRINALQNMAPGVYYMIGNSTGREIVTKLIKQ